MAVAQERPERHGYLDERHFFQGNDDHDYHRRLSMPKGGARSTCRSPCMPRWLGAARRPRTGINRDVFNVLSWKAWQPSLHRFLDTLTSSSAPERIG
jgi:hypothetical protein